MNRTRLFISIGLFVAGLALYAPCSHFGFVQFDDPGYVTQNPHLRNGLSPTVIRWALTATDEANWHPLTWLSHAVDVEIFGLEAGGHHFVSVLLHTLNGLLLFWIFAIATGRPWAAAIASALFLVHPLHVESVAWIAERKDVLSAFFGLAALLAYVAYAKFRRRAWYAVSLALFALGLCAKPMIVTLPLLMLLMDWWPLQRFKASAITPGVDDLSPRSESWLRALREKVPFALLSAASCVITIWAQNAGGTIASVEKVPIAWRAMNAVLSIGQYLRQMVWPSGLSVFYAHPWLSGGTISRAALIAWGAVLLVMTAVAIAQSRRRPFLLFSWAWFIVSLIPVLGLVQVGNQARADRYTYLPSLGIFVAVAYALSSLCQRYTRATPAVVGGCAAVILALALVTHVQIGHWKDTISLFEHALSIDPDNAIAYSQLGSAYAEAGKLDEAVEASKRAVSLYDAVAERWPGENSPVIFNRTNLASFYVQRQDIPKALETYGEAVARAPNDLNARIGYGMTLQSMQRADEAMAEFQAARATHPESALPLIRIANIAIERRQYGAAAEGLRAAVDKDRASIEGLSTLAWLLATCPDTTIRNPTEARALAGEAVMRSEGNDAIAINALAAATAETGDLMKAIELSNEAIRVAQKSGMGDAADSFAAQLRVYESGQTLTGVQNAAPGGPSAR